ncbi:MAG: VOC family protein, partial [Pseudomonadota bacterium]
VDGDTKKLYSSLGWLERTFYGSSSKLYTEYFIASDTQDIREDHRYFSDRGFNFWSSPVQHDFGEQVGQPIEVVFDGPDGVAINPVQLESLKADSLIAEMRGYVEQYGRTSKGFTPVVTSAHFVRDIDAAVEFHEKVLDMRLTIDKELTAPESNHFLGLPEDARTRTVFVQGAHMFGKVCLVKPLNYDCSDMVPLASAPNIGYLSQLFRVPDMDRALAACKDLGVEFFSQPARTEFPSLGQTDIAMVRHPGSGALIQVYRA